MGKKMSERMNLKHCEREQEVVDALTSGRWATAWGEDIRRHAEVCTACAEVAFVTQEFRREADAELLQAALPSAGLVWWKAQRAARRAAEERAAEPIRFVERAAFALVALSLLGLGAWKWTSITGWIRHAGELAILPNLGATPAILLAATAAVFLSVMALAAYVGWRKD